MSAKATLPTTTYRATLPDGTVEEFTSKVHYTHAVWVKWPNHETQGVIKRTANPTAALKQPGQTPRQSSQIKAHCAWGLVELEVVS